MMELYLRSHFYIAGFGYLRVLPTFFFYYPGGSLFNWVPGSISRTKMWQSDKKSHTGIIFMYPMKKRRKYLLETLGGKTCRHQDSNLQPSDPRLLSLQSHLLYRKFCQPLSSAETYCAHGDVRLTNQLIRNWEKAFY